MWNESERIQNIFPKINICHCTTFSEFASFRENSFLDYGMVLAYKINCISQDITDAWDDDIHITLVTAKN